MKFGGARGARREIAFTEEGGESAACFGGALEALKISAAGDRLVSEAVGEIETEDGVLVIRRIYLKLNLKRATKTARQRSAFTGCTGTAARCIAR